MDFLRSKTLRVKKKWHKLKRNSFKTQTLSIPVVSSSSVASSFSSSSSFPDYHRETEVFANTYVSPITPIPMYPTQYLSNDHGDQFSKKNDHGDHHHSFEIPASSTSNSVDEQLVSSSSVSSQPVIKKIKSPLSPDVLVLSTVGIALAISGMTMGLFLLAYPSASAPEDGSKFIYSVPAPGNESHFIYLAPEHKSKLQVRHNGLIVPMISMLYCGFTCCLISLIGKLFPKRFTWIAWIAVVCATVGLLLVSGGIFGLMSSMLPKSQLWLPWLCYSMLVMVVLACTILNFFVLESKLS